MRLKGLQRPRLIRRIYANALEAVVDSPLRAGPDRQLNVYTFSSERHLPEQVASLRSLLRHLGVPHRILVVSDGSHPKTSIALLERVHPCVTAAHYGDVVAADLPPAVQRYARASPLGVKLALQLSFLIEPERPTFYADADVLFFPGITELTTERMRGDRNPRYLQDFDSRFFDHRLITGADERERPTNSGAQLLFEPLTWDTALGRLEALEGDPEFLTEQTVIHLAMRESGGMPFPRESFVLEVDDEHDWRDRYASREIALRHYCFSEAVQRKLWLNVWDDLAALARAHPRAATSAGVAGMRTLWAESRHRPQPDT